MLPRREDPDTGLPCWIRQGDLPTYGRAQTANTRNRSTGTLLPAFALPIHLTRQSDGRPDDFTADPDQLPSLFLLESKFYGQI